MWFWSLLRPKKGESRKEHSPSHKDVEKDGLLRDESQELLGRLHLLVPEDPGKKEASERKPSPNRRLDEDQCQSLPKPKRSKSNLWRGRVSVQGKDQRKAPALLVSQHSHILKGYRLRIFRMFFPVKREDQKESKESKEPKESKPLDSKESKEGPKEGPDAKEMKTLQLDVPKGSKGKIQETV